MFITLTLVVVLVDHSIGNNVRLSLVLILVIDKHIIILADFHPRRLTPLTNMGAPQHVRSVIRYITGLTSVLMRLLISKNLIVDVVVYGDHSIGAVEVQVIKSIHQPYD